MDKRDRFEEIFRERLHDLEVDPGILPARKMLWLSRRRKLLWQAAMAALLLTSGGLWLFLHQPSQPVPERSASLPPLPAFPPAQSRVLSVAHDLPVLLLSSDLAGKGKKMATVRRTISPISIDSGQARGDRRIEPALLTTAAPPMTLSLVFPTTSHHLQSHKWRIGFGSSSFGITGISMNGGSTADYRYNDYARPEIPQPPEVQNKLKTRARTTWENPPQDYTKTKHFMPVSFGLVLARPLSNRWSLQTGVSYTYLYSKWKNRFDGSVVQRQHLHLLGIPLGMSYRLTNWQKPYCYLSTGIAAEINIAGHIRNTDGKHHLRIPGILWTAKAKTGIAYPLFRFLGIYAEGGICYYSDYKGTIETIRSRHAFNLSGQIGIQINF